jgi:hypothetical protein
MHRLALIAAFLTVTAVPQTQAPTAQDRLDAVVQQITARGRATGPAPDPAELLK